MAKPKKRSIFERLAGGIRLEDDNENDVYSPLVRDRDNGLEAGESWAVAAEEPEGELSLDVYQTPSDIIIQTFVAGVKPEDLDINITRDMLTIRGKRHESRTVEEGDFFSKELYWGSFSRTISLPQEVEPEEAEAIERHGLLTIKLPKIDKHKKSQLKVKSL